MNLDASSTLGAWPRRSIRDRVDLAWFARVVEQSASGIWTVDATGTTDYVNPRMCQMLGFDAAEMIGRRFTDFVPVADSTWAEATFDSRKAGRSQVGGVCDLIAKDGRAVRMRYDASPLTDETGTMIGAMTVITEASAVPPDSGFEHAWRERVDDDTQRHFAFLVHHASDFIGMCDLDFHPFFVNRAGITAVGLPSRADVTVFDFFFPDDHEFLRTQFFPLVLCQGHAVTEVRFKHFETGAPVWMRYSVVRLDARTGEPMGYATISQDLTEQRRAADLLQQLIVEKDDALQQFRELADSMPQIVWAAGADGVIDYRNRQWYEKTRRPPGDRRDATEFVHPSDHGPLGAKWSVGIASGESFEAELRLKFPGDVDYRWYVARAVAVRDERGAIVRWYGTHTDIHEWKVAEAERHEQARALAAANQNKDAFLARLAHELRNPLAAMTMAIELLKHKLDADSPIQRQQMALQRQTRHITRLVEDLLDVSRIGLGKIELRRQRIDAVALARDAIDSLRPMIDARRHQIDTDLPDAPVYVDADPARLMQVAINLLTNAVKYTPPGGHLQVSIVVADGIMALLVRDNGIGISAEMLPHIFDLYAQADRTKSDADGGLGIGLHLVQSLVRLHGGTISVASGGPRQGSEFEVRLPVA